MLPLSLALVLLVGLLLLFAWFAWRRRSGLTTALAALVGALLVSTAVAWVCQWAMSLVRHGAWWRGYPDVTSFAVYAGSLLVCAAAVILVRRRAVGTLRAAYWLLFLLIGGGISLAAPGGSILFLFPPLAAAGGMILERWIAGAERGGAFLAALVLLLIFLPFLDLLEMFLGHGAAWIYAPLAALILLPFLIELAPRIGEAGPRPLLGALAALLVAGWAAVGLTPAYSQERRQQFGIEYLWEAGAGRARWLIANDGAPLPSSYDRFGPWERRVEVPYSGRRRWAAAAPPMPVSPPRVEAVAQAPAGPGRHVSFRLATGGADATIITIPAQARPVAAGAERLVRAAGGEGGSAPFYLRCTGRACDGRYFTVTFATREPVEVTLVGIRNALPPTGAALQQARPPLAQPQYGTDATVAVGRARF